MVLHGNHIVDKGRFFFSRILAKQCKRTGGKKKTLENHRSAPHIEILDLDSNHQWGLKPLGERLMGTPQMADRQTTSKPTGLPINLSITKNGVTRPYPP